MRKSKWKSVHAIKTTLRGLFLEYKPLTFTSTLKTSSHFSVTLLHTIEGIKNN